VTEKNLQGNFRWFVTGNHPGVHPIAGHECSTSSIRGRITTAIRSSKTFPTRKPSTSDNVHFSVLNQNPCLEGQKLSLCDKRFRVARELTVTYEDFSFPLRSSDFRCPVRDSAFRSNSTELRTSKMVWKNGTVPRLSSQSPIRPQAFRRNSQFGSQH